MFGFQCINDNAVVQIDENYRNLLRVASGTAAPGDVVTFPAQTSAPPMVFVRPSSDGVYVGLMSLTNNTFTAQANGSFDWVVYGLDSPVQVDATNMGIQVFSSTGALTYDSRYESPRIRETLSVNQQWPTYTQGGSLGQYPAYPYTISFTSWGSRPWFCLNQMINTADAYGNIICATTSGLAAIIVRCGSMLPGGWSWSSNNGAGGSYAVSYPGGRLRIPILQR